MRRRFLARVCHQAVDNNKLRSRFCCIAQVLENLDAQVVWVVVHDHTDEENVRILDDLRGKEIVR